MDKSFISLFSGAGGLDRGLVDAGWTCRYASDIDNAAVQTLQLNADVDGLVERADVTQLSGKDVLARAGARKGDVPVLVGGPPCQSWSSAGHQLGWEDPRGRLFQDFIRIANEADVRFVMFENVRGLLTARGPDGVPGSALEFIRRQLLNVGFATTVALVNAADYGVAQRRVRLFVVGHRVGDIAFAPRQTHAKDDPGLARWVTLGTCLQSIAPVRSDEIVRPTGLLATQLADIAPGSGVKSMGKAERTRPGGHWGYKQGAFIADLDVPARTVTASGQQDWICDPVHGLRKLSPRECAAIQSFPADWRWPSGAKLSDLYRLIGNSVPPLLARSMGLALAEAMDNSSARRRSVVGEHLLPLPKKLADAISYTAREEASNGESRRQVPPRRRSSLDRPRMHSALGN